MEDRVKRQIKIDWAKVDLNKYPHLVTKEIPGPRSVEMHGRARNHEGVFRAVKLFRWRLKGHGVT